MRKRREEREKEGRRKDWRKPAEKDERGGSQKESAGWSAVLRDSEG